MPRGLTERVGEQAVLGYTRRGGRIGEVDLCSDGAQSRSGTGVGRKSHVLLGNMGVAGVGEKDAKVECSREPYTFVSEEVACNLLFMFIFLIIGPTHHGPQSCVLDHIKPRHIPTIAVI